MTTSSATSENWSCRAAVITAGGFGWAQWRAAEEREARQEKEKLLVRAVEAEKTARASLYSQALVLAKAECGAREQGRRFRALEAIARETRLHPGDPDLRDVAITALCVPDWQTLRTWPPAEGLPPPSASPTPVRASSHATSASRPL